MNNYNHLDHLDHIHITDQMQLELLELKKKVASSDRGRLLKQINALVSLRQDNEDLHQDLLEEKEKVSDLKMELKLAQNRISVLEKEVENNRTEIKYLQSQY